MILNDRIAVKLGPSNLKHYKLLGYDNLKSGNILVIPIKHLNKGSHSLVDVQCEICKKEKKLMYKEYYRNTIVNDIYVCSSKCAYEAGKNKTTFIKKYGFEHSSQVPEIKEKTIHSRLGNTEISKKTKQTCLDRYGFENISQVPKFKEKRKETMLERHGVEYYVLSEDFVQKSKDTSLKNFGTTHPKKSNLMKEKAIEEMRNRGLNINSIEFKLYTNKIQQLTRKVKSELLSNWNGYDYYDNEYIKDNFNLPYYHGKYPTIDHKICIFEGFKNNIEPENIANINNLCLTKRCINSQKRIESEETFKIKFTY